MHYSPQVALLETVIATFLLIFFVYHGWCYDRFSSYNVLKIVEGQRDAFKRVMVLLYFVGCVCFVVQGAVYAWIKYQAGFLPIAMTGMPMPFQLWPQSHQDLIPTLQYLYATTFFCELVVHLEEVLFFLHLIQMKPSSPPWFQSVYFKIVVAGSTLFAVLCFGTVALWKDNPLVGEGVLSLIGSSFILLSNFVFFKVFYEFPGVVSSPTLNRTALTSPTFQFIAKLKIAGGTSQVVIRLKSFHELNKLRVAARFAFGIPIFVLAVDGLTSTRLNRQLVYVDTLLFTAFAGFSIQATLTLLIFFPRNVAREAGVLRPTTSAKDIIAASTGSDSASAYKPSLHQSYFPPSPSAYSTTPPTFHGIGPPPSPRRTGPRTTSDHTTIAIPPHTHAHSDLTSPPTNIDLESEKTDDEKVAGEAYSFGTGGRRGPVGQVFVIQHGGTERNGTIENASTTARSGSVDDGQWGQRSRGVATIGPGGGVLGGRRPSIPFAIRSFTSPIDIV
ncbi:hypothetical protein RQP46_007862 [Phenoliferia psychrophenolica]